jgi:hypothetical protein
MAGLEARQGSKKTLDFYENEDVDDEVAETLSDLLCEHLIAGEKCLQFYHFSKQQLAQLRAHVDGLELEESKLRDCFPCVASPDDLRGGGWERPRLVHRLTDDRGTFLLASSIREYEERVEVDVNALPAAVKRNYGEIKELIGVRIVKKQVFDAVWIPRNGYTVITAVDFPRGAPSDFVVPGQIFLRQLIRHAAGVRVDPINLFGAIDAVYESDWGKVVELGFTTDTGSVKHEKMRLRRPCLRREAFHVGGKEAVDGVLHPFQVSVRWDAEYPQDLDGHPELTLHGTARMLHHAQPLYDAVFRHGLRIGDLHMLKLKLVPLARRVNADA